ncbi:MAG: hypothetical protein SFY32_02130 [Bacteroidota bacterium]|nr:hypothetical protein [Bacteroidota bacterium]
MKYTRLFLFIGSLFLVCFNCNNTKKDNPTPIDYLGQVTGDYQGEVKFTLNAYEPTIPINDTFALAIAKDVPSLLTAINSARIYIYDSYLEYLISLKFKDSTYYTGSFIATNLKETNDAVVFSIPSQTLKFPGFEAIIKGNPKIEIENQKFDGAYLKSSKTINFSYTGTILLYSFLTGNKYTAPFEISYNLSKK